MAAKRVEISCDDGHPLDFKLIELLKKYNLDCTFYIAPLNTELTDDQIREISKDFEIGGHTLSHAILTAIEDEDTIRDEVTIGKKYLENIIGRKITKFCYPRGRYSDRVKRIVKEAGFEQARTTKILCTNTPEDPYEYHTSVHAFQNPRYDEHWVSAALRMWDNNPEYFHIWLHSWEVERDKQWTNLEYLLKKVTE